MNNIATNPTNPTTTTPAANAKPRGRVKGSSDSIGMKVSDLLARFGPDTVVPVRRKWLTETVKNEAVTAALATIPVQPDPAIPAPANLDESLTVPDAEPAANADAPKIQFSVS